VIDEHLRRVAFLVAACFFMENLDGTIVVTAIPKISEAVSASPAATGLIVSAYLITLAVLIPLSGWMTSRFGGRRVFLAAICIFTVASLACALATSLGELVAFRIVQGVGGAMMVPVGRIVVFADAQKSQIVRLMSYIVWPGLLAPVLAPLVGGVITTYAGWRWLFLINIPLGIVALGCAWRLIHAEPAPSTPPLDRVGVLLTCTGLGALTYAAHLVSDAQPAWAGAAALGLAAGVVLVLAARHLLASDAPLVDLRTMQIRTFGAAVTGSAMFWLVVGAIPFLLPLLFQTVFGWSAIRSGAVILFLFVGNIAIKPATTQLLNRLGFRTTLLCATTALGLTTFAMALLGPQTPLPVIALLLLLSGVARSVGLTGYTTLGLSDVPPEQMRSANALAATVQQLFSGLGVAAATLALRAGQSLQDALSQSSDGATAFRVAFMLLGLVALAAGADGLRLHASAGQAVIARRR
jgi:EmrB/QacA subfamily drug resistance transporter